MIVEDDLMARNSSEKLCEKFDFLNLKWSCEDGNSALEALKMDSPDLIFLDVEMPDMNGFKFLDKANNVKQVIFTTGKSQNAAEAFRYKATDFLVKPIDKKDFQTAVEKALEIHNLNYQYQHHANSVYIKENGKYIRIAYDDIQYFENEGDYIKVFMNNGSHLFHGTLRNIATKLTDARFLKVHRTYIVNLDKIVDIEENTLVIGRKVIPISRANKPILMNRLNIL